MNSRRDEIAREASKNNFCDVVESIHVEVDSDRTITNTDPTVVQTTLISLLYGVRGFSKT